MLKFLGFIKEYNPIEGAISFDESLGNDTLEQITLFQVIEYLNKSVVILAWMGYFIDIQTKELIAPDCYYSDGIWVWPSYLPYYLKKYPNFKIDPNFLAYLTSKGYSLNNREDIECKRSLFEKEIAVLLAGD